MFPTRGSARNSSGVSATRRVSASRTGPSPSMTLGRGGGSWHGCPLQWDGLELLENMRAVTVIAAARPRRRSQSRVTLRHPLKLLPGIDFSAVSYTHLRAHETGRNLVC